MRQNDIHIEKNGNGQVKSILLAHGKEIIRTGLRLLIESRICWLQVIGEASNLPDALQKLQEFHPDIVLIDAELPPAGSLEAIRQLLAMKVTNVLVLSPSSDIHFCCEAIRAGAHGFVLKSSPIEEFVTALRAVAAKQVFISSAMTDSARATVFSSDCQLPSDQGITARECEVLQLLSDGQATKEIAQALGISTRTVETHRVQIMNKLQIRSAAGLTKYAIRHGLTRL